MEDFIAPEATRMAKFGGPSVWVEFSPLSALCKSVNLGQGFPGWAPLPFVTDAATHAIQSGAYSQYARSPGQLNLVKTIAAQYGPRFGRTLDPLKEVCITVGASGAISYTLTSFVNPGDEVVVLEPAFDIYYGAIDLAGAVARPVPLRSKPGLTSAAEFYIDMQELEAAFSDKTRMVIINSPHNPTGKVFTRKEYDMIAQLLRKFPNVVVLSDEVYEHLVFDDIEFVPFASVPGMYDRTVSVYSSGKTFSVTGWKVGWTVGPPNLISKIQLANQWVNFSVATPLQEAVCMCLERGAQPYEGFSTYYKWLAQFYTKKRDFLVGALRDAGFRPIVPSGAFFIMADTSAVEAFEATSPPQGILDYVANGDLAIDPATYALRDYNFARYLTLSKGVTPIPVSAFHSPHLRHLAANFARFAFCKKDEDLALAASRLIPSK